MYTDTCFLCFTKDKRTINIVKTHLQPVYEKLTDSKIEYESHNLCYVCHTRLQQSYQLSTLAKQNQSLLISYLECFDKLDNEIDSCGSLLDLSIMAEVKISLPFDEVKVEKQERNDDDIGAATEQMHNIVDEVQIKIERQFTGDNSQDSEDYYDDENFKNFPGNNVDTLLIEMPELEGLNNFIDDEEQQTSNTDIETKKRQRHFIETKIIDGVEHFACHYCPFVNKRKMNVVIHERAHTGNKPFTCEICNRNFARKSNLNAHYNTHTGYKPHKCDVCKRGFSALGALTRHKRIHTGEKPYTCDICLKRFADKFHMRTHINTHAGLRPHNCDVCNQNFADVGGLNRHKRVHTGEKPYNCEVCNRKFSDKSHLNAHKFIHLGYKLFACEVCGKKFSQSGSLRWHKRKHMGMKTYTCDICDRSFKEKGHLKEHMNMHTGDRPYSCKYCNQKFCHSSSRYRHQRTHMMDEPHTFCEVQLMDESVKEVNVKYISNRQK